MVFLGLYVLWVYISGLVFVSFNLAFSLNNLSIFVSALFDGMLNLYVLPFGAHGIIFMNVCVVITVAMIMLLSLWVIFMTM
jgi:hypothetical protein